VTAVLPAAEVSVVEFLDFEFVENFEIGMADFLIGCGRRQR
jgi:hypothetical protein